MTDKNRIGALFVVALGLSLLAIITDAPVLWASPGTQGTVPLPTLTPTRRPTQAQTQRAPTLTPAPGARSATPRPTVPGETPQPTATTDAFAPQATRTVSTTVRATATVTVSFQIPEGQITCAVGRGGICGISEGLGDVSIQFPNDFASLGTLVTIVPIGTASDIFAPQVLGSLVFVGHAYQLQVLDPDGKPIDSFNPPLELNFIYSSNDLQKAESNPNRFAVLFYNRATNSWDTSGITNQTVNDQRHLVRANVNRLGIVALFAAPANGIIQTNTSSQPGWFDGIWQFLKQLFGIK